MKRQTLASTGGFIAAVIASLCCIGPVLIALLGFGSIAALSTFEVYRPYFIAFTVALLGFAFFLTYKKREVICEDGTCKHKSASKWSKASLWIVTVLAGLAIAFPHLGFAPQTQINESVDSTSTVTLKIEGMDCAACASGVEGSLAAIEGVRKARVDYEQGKATVDYDSRIVLPTDFIDRINQAGLIATIEKRR